MTSKRYIAFCAAGFAAIALLFVITNVSVDMFGLFRSGAGRKISIYGEERIAKYLYSFRYIPEGFDGILLGSSVSENFDLGRFQGYRLYNASINGGNVSDLKPIAENIYSKRRVKLSIVAIHRYLTKDHARKTDFMSPREYWGALGSPQLITAYVVRTGVRLKLIPSLYDEQGTLRFGADPEIRVSRSKIEQTVIDMRAGTAAVGNFDIDPIALEQLNQILSLARNRSERLVIFYPPTPEQVLSECTPRYVGYRDTINALTRGGDIVIDFNSPEYESLRTNYANFVDGVHLSAAGANTVVDELARHVEQAEARRLAGAL